jgi:hypothetical protein
VIGKRTPCQAREEEEEDGEEEEEEEEEEGEEEEEDAASVYGYTGSTLAHSRDTVSGQGGGCGECVRVHLSTISKQSGRRAMPGKRRQRVCTYCTDTL